MGSFLVRRRVSDTMTETDRILVTGSEGSLMQWTISNLLDRGFEVVGADNYARYEDYDHTAVADPDAYEFHEADLTDYQAALDLTRDVDGIINAAAMIYGVKGFHEHPADILSNDITVVRNVLEAAEENDVNRVAYISSSMVYEQDEPPHSEEDIWDNQIPSTDYGLSKVTGERLHMAFQRQYDIDYTIWRPFNILTPLEIAEDEAGTSHVFADFIRKIMIEKQNPMEIFGSGEQVRCFTWVDEVAETIAEQSFADATRNEAYNLANPEPVTMKELAQRIHSIAVDRGVVADDSLEFEHVEIYDDDVKKRIPSVEKAEDDFGWQPELKLDQMLTQYIDNMDDLYPEDLSDSTQQARK